MEWKKYKGKRITEGNAIHLEEVEELKQTQVTCETKRIKTKVPWCLKNRHESESTMGRENLLRAFTRVFSI